MGDRFESELEFANLPLGEMPRAAPVTPAKPARLAPGIPDRYNSAMDRRTLLIGSLGLGLPAAAAQDPSPKGTPGKRFALILANQKYASNPLPNIDNDAALMGRTLRALGFEVATASNCRRPEMRSKLKELRERLSASPGAIGFVYYSGHGVQVDGENYLVPVDNSGLGTEADVKEDCLSLSYVLDIVKGTGAKAYIVVLDACRDNPFLGQKGDGGKGLAVVARKVDEQTLIAFAASPGETASATAGGSNSIYTAELARNLAQPNRSLLEVFQSTRAGVRTKSGNKQRPREDNGLEEAIHLNGVGTSPAPIAAPAVKVGSTEVRLELAGLPAGAKVTVDDRALSGSVYTDEIAARTKDVEVAVDAAGFRPYLRTVTLKRGESARLAVELEAKPAAAPAPTPVRGSRLTDYPQLRVYVEAMRPIPAGTFRMGGNKFDDEKPVHAVRLSAYRLGATPATVAMWKEYCVATGKSMPSAPGWGWIDDHPMVNVSWNDILGADGKGGYAAWASEVSGLRLTLPTEAQWERAARGDVDGQEYPWGNGLDDSKLWCSFTTSRGKTAPVSRSSNVFRNAFGLSDMSGNVWQWCLDWYGPYGPGDAVDPVGPASGDERVLRGGSWNNSYDNNFRCADRFGISPDFRVNIYGFRLSISGP